MATKRYWVGMADVRSKLRPIKFDAIPSTSNPGLEREFRMKHQSLYDWNHDYWSKHNVHFDAVRITFNLFLHNFLDLYIMLRKNEHFWTSCTRKLEIWAMSKSCTFRTWNSANSTGSFSKVNEKLIRNITGINFILQSK